MKRMILAVLFCFALVSVAGAQGYGHGRNPNNRYVNPYVTNRGVFMPRYFQTNPRYYNYGTRGNLNPYAGQTFPGVLIIDY